MKEKIILVFKDILQLDERDVQCTFIHGNYHVFLYGGYLTITKLDQIYKRIGCSDITFRAVSDGIVFTIIF